MHTLIAEKDLKIISLTEAIEELQKTKSSEQDIFVSSLPQKLKEAEANLLENESKIQLANDLTAENKALTCETISKMENEIEEKSLMILSLEKERDSLMSVKEELLQVKSTLKEKKYLFGRSLIRDI